MSSGRRLIHLVSANTWGGGERYALDVCRSFASEGWDTVVFTRDAQVVDSEFRAASITVRHAPLKGYFDFASALILARYIASDPRPTLIHVHKYKDAFTALLARKLSRRKDVATVITRHLVRPAKNTALLRRVYRNLSAQVFVSRLALDRFLSVWPADRVPFPMSRVYTLHNSINIRPRPLMPLPESGPIIAMYHGRLDAEKGLDTLIRALPALKGKRTRLWIVGTGKSDYVDHLHQLAESLGVLQMIDWKGYMSDVHSLIPKVHFGVLPSSAREAFGLTNIEYMANGRVQICTSNGAQSEYLTADKDALIVPPDDVAALQAAMIKLAENPSLCASMGKNAYDRFYESMSWNYFIDSMRGIYDDAFAVVRPIS